MILCCTSFTHVNVSIALDKRRADSVYSLQWDCIGNLKILHQTVRQSDIAWKVVTQNLMKGNGKHGYTI